MIFFNLKTKKSEFISDNECTTEVIKRKYHKNRYKIKAISKLVPGYKLIAFITEDDYNKIK
jgi:hypothetical protein